MPKRTPSVLIVGAGSIGSAYGAVFARLHSQGLLKLSMKATPRHLAALAKGIEMVDPDGKVLIEAEAGFLVSDNWKDLSGRCYDYIVDATTVGALTADDLGRMAAISIC